MLRYLRTHRFSSEECQYILSLRAPYQPLSRQLWEYVHYWGGTAETFVQEEYTRFVQTNGRLPVKRKKQRGEYDLCKLMERYLDVQAFPYLSHPAPPPKFPQKIRESKSPDETFQEAMDFYQEHGRFPLHVHRGEECQRPYEGKLAARVTALYRAGRFSPQQMEVLDRLRPQNGQRAQLVYEAFFVYIQTHGGQVPRHQPHTPENRLLNNLKNHMRQGHYTQAQLQEILTYLPGRRREYPALDGDR